MLSHGLHEFGSWIEINVITAETPRSQSYKGFFSVFSATLR